jgi:hypothetical protein
MDNVTYAYVGDIVKTNTEDGDLIVYGKATGPDIDLDEQICDPNWLRTAMPEWMKFGNLREMHQPIAAGVGLDLEAKGDDWFLKSQVIDENTKRKIEAGVLKGYSVGIKNAKVVKDAAARGGRIVSGTIVEVSYVDRPCNPTATATIAKAVGSDWTAVETQIVDVDADITKDVTPEYAEPQAQTIEVVEDVTENSEWKPEDMYQPAPNNEPGEYPSDHACSVCDGLGKYPETGATCVNCGGSGRVQEAPVEDSVAQNDDDQQAAKDAEAEVEKREFSQAERDEAEAKGQAMPGGGFPIKTVQDLKNAIQSIGRAKDPAAAKAHIKTRAAALGREDLIPENWKGVDADLTKDGAVMDDGSEMEHDPADLIAVRSAMIALIKAELDEMLAGKSDEICDVSDLLVSLKIFLDWWVDEASENQTTAPFTSWDMDDSKDDDQMAYVALGVDADIIKAAASGDEADVTALRSEIVKALNLEETVTEIAKAAQREEVDFLKAELERVKEMAAPGGPALARTQAQSSKALDAERMQSEARHLRHIAGPITDPELKASYMAKAAKLDKSAAELLGA